MNTIERRRETVVELLKQARCLVAGINDKMLEIQSLLSDDEPEGDDDPPR